MELKYFDTNRVPRIAAVIGARVCCGSIVVIGLIMTFGSKGYSFGDVISSLLGTAIFSFCAFWGGTLAGWIIGWIIKLVMNISCNTPTKEEERAKHLIALTNDYVGQARKESKEKIDTNIWSKDNTDPDSFKNTWANETARKVFFDEY
jgi:hypothetical protein